MIAICTPSRGEVGATFAYDLVQLIKHTPDAEFAIALGTYLPNLRTQLVQKCLDSHLITHVLFIDSDMRFPKDTIERLLAHNKDIVGANCKKRTERGWTARMGGRSVSSKDKSGLQEVDNLGFGITLIKIQVFGLPQPWFATPYDGLKYVGEDIFFCHTVKQAGYKIYIDHDLSLEIKHTGTKEY